MNTISKPYNLVARILHWAIAILIFWAIALGLVAEGMPNSPDKIELFVLHKSAGFTVLVLAVVRLFWRLAHPPAPLGLPPLKEKLASAGHWGLYLLMLAVPLSGWLLNSAAGYPFAWFNLISVPHIPGLDNGSRDLFSSLHEYLFYIIALMVAGHIAMLVLHKLLDGISLLPRMLPGKSFVSASALSLVLVVLIGFTFYKAEEKSTASPDVPVAAQLPTVPATQQEVNQSDSTLWEMVATPDNFKFTNSYAGQPFTGAIRQFTPAIYFDPADPESGIIDVTINTQSITTNNKDWDGTIKGSQWFATEAHPEAHYLSRDIRKENGKFIADGELTLKGITKPISVTFSWQESNGEARFIGSATIDRRDFEIGSGSWATNASVAYEVELSIDLKLIKQTN